MQMDNPEIKFYRFLNAKLNLSEEDAETFIALQKEIQADKLATKGDLAEVNRDLSGQISHVEKDLSGKITAVKAELNIKIAQTKTALTWRMFIFWLGQVAATLAIVRYAMS